MFPTYRFIAVFTLFATPTAHAENPVSSLQGTKWRGNFSNGIAGAAISIEFLPDLQHGDLQYYHELPEGNVTSEALSLVDKRCKYTPRTIHLDPPGNESGKISVYLCAPGEKFEKLLAKNPNRSILKKVDVKKFSLRPDGKHLTIVASIAGKDVTYELDPAPRDFETDPPVPGLQTPAN
jgi:hypothetical protein